MSGADLAKIVLVVRMNARAISLQKLYFFMFLYRTYKRHSLENGFVNQNCRGPQGLFSTQISSKLLDNFFCTTFLKLIFGFFGHTWRYIIFIVFQNLVNSPSS